ncbi:MAG: hypothetical protein HYY45_09645 [Deltaproteobacteria bacterium]|nr:hypothetical protein [Deltaproteobacteria bacterium]
MVCNVVKHGFSSPPAAAAMLATVIFFVSLSTWAQERDLAEYFKGKKVEIVVGSAPGGGYDLNARLIARFIGKYLPGGPSAVVVRNMPGGGGQRGLGATMRARPDGLTVGTLQTRWVLRELLGIDVPDFDLDTARFLGSPSGGAKRERMLCVRRDVATSWEGVLKLGRPIRVGSSGRAAQASIGPEFVELIGGPIKMIYGYGGMAEVMAAFDRGELDMVRCTEEVVARPYPEWIKKKILAAVFWWNAAPSEDWLRRLEAPTPPHLFDAVKPTEEQKRVFQVAVGLLETMTRAFVMPPGVPNDIYQAWRNAFEATVRDPEFVKGAEVAVLEVGLATVEDFERVIRGFRELSPAGRGLVKKLMGE